MSEFEKAGPIISLTDMAKYLEKQINNDNAEGIKKILNSFEDINTASDLINYLSTKDFDRLIQLQEKANTNEETIEEAEITEYVSISDRIATGLLCIARLTTSVIDKASNQTNNFFDNISTTASETRDNAICVFNTAENMSNDIKQYTYNTYKHTEWFLRTVLKNNEVNDQVKLHITNQYGHLLFTYDPDLRTFKYDNSLTDILMPIVLGKIKEVKGINRSATESPYTAEQALQNVANKKANTQMQRTQSLGEDTKFAYTDTDRNKIEDYIIDNKDNTTMVPRIVIINAIKEQNNKRKREGESYVEKEGKEPQTKKARVPTTGGKIRRQTRRKIRRNKKAKTKKRKTNKKTKKRKMKTKVNRKKTKRKTNKRRTKK